MAYVNVAEWRPEQVTEWLKGLESCILPYLHWFSNNEVNGQQLLHICPDELAHLGVYKIGHQELILEGVQHLRNFHYELDRENLQALALRVSCAAHSLYCEVRTQSESTSVPSHIMSDVSNAVNQVKALVSWLDRSPFSGKPEYTDLKRQMLHLSLKMALSAQLDRFAENPMSTFRECSMKLAKFADSIIQEATDPMILQPAYLDLATLKKRAGEDLGFFLVPSFHGEHQIGEMKLSSPAHQSGKIQPGDEIVQINYQTVVGWERKKVLALIEESPNDLLLTLKRRPRHVNLYGQMYMKPYRLPSRKRASPYTRWNDNLPSPRPEFLTIPHFDIPSRSVAVAEATKQAAAVLEEASVASSSSDEEFPPEINSSSPTSARIYLPKPRAPIQRRYTLSGPARPSVNIDQFWRELQLERSWRSNQNNSQTEEHRSEENIVGPPLREKSVSVDASVACDKSANVDNTALHDARSIIQLNKVKRDAFFSNMGCPPKPTTPRGRLDKSRSTPAYDLGEPENKDGCSTSGSVSVSLPPQPSPRNANAILIKQRKVSDTVKSVAASEVDESEAMPKFVETMSEISISIARTTSTRELAAAAAAVAASAVSSAGASVGGGEPEHGQMVNTINQTLRSDPDEDAFFSEVPPAPREIRPVAAQRKMVLPPAPPPKPKPRPLPPEPPEPPPRPEHHSNSPTHSASPPSPSTSSQSGEGKERTKNTLDHLKAMWTLGRSSSPRSARKQNPALTRRRQVAAKDLSPCEVSGILWHRRRRGSGTWQQGFFILQGPAFYGFRHKDRPRADLFIFLPGFTCSVAQEVKSKSHAFKIYHTGTVFYFAAESEEELQQWLDGATMATTSLEEGHQGDTSGWSETDSDSSDTEQPPDSCCPTGSRVSRLLALGVPARSHQNLASDSAVKCDSPRKFSSLKKLSTSKAAPVSTESNHAASLDRKFRFPVLSPKNVPVPVPTSQFRSYRRMQPAAAPPRPPTHRDLRMDLSRPPTVQLNSPDGNRSLVVGMEGNEGPRLSRRALHSSNPSLVNPEMADYRMTQERLREFRNLRTQGRPIDLSGFMTLEQFMLSRQEEERNLRSGRHTRTRVYPSQTREAPLDSPRRDSLAGSSSSNNINSSDKPQVAPRTALPPAKVKLQSTPTPPSPSSSCEGNDPVRPQALPDYPGIEYPPAFEPETYTLQYMLKNRRKRDNPHK